MSSNNINQLIQACRTYLSTGPYIERRSKFVEWVIKTAINTDPTDNDVIENQFQVARIWGHDDLLDAIKDQLRLLSEPELQFEESAAKIINHHLIEVSTTPDRPQGSHSLIKLGDWIITIQPSISESQCIKLKTELMTMSVINANNLAGILRRVIETTGSIFNRVPKHLLVELPIRGEHIYLIKGSIGMVVIDSRRCPGGHCYVGRLNSECDELIDIRAQHDVIRLPYNDNQSIKLSSSLKSMNHSEEFMNTVRANVSNPEFFKFAKIKYEVMILDTSSVNEGSTCIPLGYQMNLVITPKVIDDEILLAIDTKVQDKNQSVHQLRNVIDKLVNA